MLFLARLHFKRVRTCLHKAELSIRCIQQMDRASLVTNPQLISINCNAHWVGRELWIKKEASHCDEAFFSVYHAQCMEATHLSRMQDWVCPSVINHQGTVLTSCDTVIICANHGQHWAWMVNFGPNDLSSPGINTEYMLSISSSKDFIWLTMEREHCRFTSIIRGQSRINTFGYDITNHTI